MLSKLLNTPTTQLGRAGRFAVYQIKIWSYCARLLKKNMAVQQASALSYHTIFGIVPLAIVMLLIFQSFPAYQHIGDKIKDFIYEQAQFNAFTTQAAGEVGGEERISLTDHMDKITSKFFKGTNRGSITLFSVIFVIWAALSLISTIEKAFNRIWHVRSGRSFLHRIINYWALLTLGPLLIGAGIYATSYYSGLGHIRESIFTSIGPTVLSYVIAVIVLFLLYFVLPNTKVLTKNALWGAAVAAIVWIAAKNIYGYSVVEFRLYNSVYGVLAIIPITVLWIFITWLIVLFGLQLTFTTQNFEHLYKAEIASSGKPEQYLVANDATAINVIRVITEAFENNQAPISGEVVCSKLDFPAELGEKLFNHLVECGLIAKTSEPTAGFIPARDPDNIKLSEISKAVADAGYGQSPAHQPEALQQIVQSQQNLLEQYTMKNLLYKEQRQTDASDTEPEE